MHISATKITRQYKQMIAFGESKSVIVVVLSARTRSLSNVCLPNTVSNFPTVFFYHLSLPNISSMQIFTKLIYSMFLRLAPSPIEVPSLILVCSPACAIYIYIISVYIFQFSSSSKLANMACPSLQTWLSSKSGFNHDFLFLLHYHNHHDHQHESLSSSL